MKDFTGLTSAEAKERLKKFGLNKLIRTKTVSPFRIFLTQFTSPLILVLIAAAIISMSIYNNLDCFDHLFIYHAKGPSQG